MPIYGGNDDRRMDWRCILYNCSVARITAILASTSSFSAARQRGPSDILLACAQISSNKNGTRERQVAFVNQTCMPLKTNALVSHQKICVNRWTYVYFGNYRQQHRMEWVIEELFIHWLQKFRVISTHQKYFPDDYNCGLCWNCIVSQQIRMCLLAIINLYLLWLRISVMQLYISDAFLH